MLEKKYRIERNKIKYILKKGEDSISKLFIIRYIKNNENHNRYCTIVSKKIDPKAVGRNKLRRQIYEAIRIHEKDIIPTNKEKSRLDIVLIPKKNILKAKFEDIEADIKNIIT